MKRRRPLWLLAGLLLFVAAAWLMSRGDRDEKAEEVARVSFPRRLKGEEYQRMTRRRTLPEPVQAAPTAAVPKPPPPPERPRDPLLAALPRVPGKTVVVVEANALTQSPVGQLLLACARREGKEDPLEVLKREVGVDVLQDLDRVAVTPEGLVLSGQFGAAKWDKLTRNTTPHPYGAQATIYEAKDEEGPHIARWGDQLIVLGDSAQDLRDSIDRIEGRGPPGEPLLDESATYGEVYGVLGTDLLEKIIGRDQPELAARVQEAVQRAELHVSAMGDVGLVAEVEGQDKEKVSDLAKALGGALSLARLKAQAQGETNLAELLDLAKVSPSGDSFNLELALPQAFLEKKLAFCREPRPAAALPASERAPSGPHPGPLPDGP